MCHIAPFLWINIFLLYIVIFFMYLIFQYSSTILFSRLLNFNYDNINNDIIILNIYKIWLSGFKVIEKFYYESQDKLLMLFKS